MMQRFPLGNAALPGRGAMVRRENLFPRYAEEQQCAAASFAHNPVLLIVLAGAL